MVVNMSWSSLLCTIYILFDIYLNQSELSGSGARHKASNLTFPISAAAHSVYQDQITCLGPYLTVPPLICL